MRAVRRRLDERERASAAGDALDDREELERAERLRQERVGARLGGLARRELARAGEQRRPACRPSRRRLQLAAEVDPGVAGHAHVEDDDLGRRAPRSPSRASAAEAASTISKSISSSVERTSVRSPASSSTSSRRKRSPFLGGRSSIRSARPAGSAGTRRNLLPTCGRGGPRRRARGGARHGANLESPRPRSSTSMIATHVSSPIRSASASGPSGWRKPSRRDRVDRRRVGDAVLERARGLVDERHQDPVRDEAGDVARLDRLLAEVARERDDRRRGLVRGRLGADHLDELEHRHRVEEVHADHAVGPAGRGGERADRDRARVRGEDRVRRERLVGAAEHVGLRGGVLDHGLDHQVGLDEAVDDGDARERLVGVGAELRERAAHRGERALGRARRRVEERDAPARTRRRPARSRRPSGPRRRRGRGGTPSAPSLPRGRGRPAHEHPGRARAAVVAVAADQRGVAAGREGDALPEVARRRARRSRSASRPRASTRSPSGR